GLAVHHLPGTHHPAAEWLADALVAEADAEQRNPAGKMADGGDRDTRVIGRAGPWRDDDLLRRQRLDLREGELIVAVHPHVGAQLTEILHHVVGEGVVIVDHQDHDSASPLASSGSTMATARKM